MAIRDIEYDLYGIIHISKPAQAQMKKRVREITKPRKRVKVDNHSVVAILLQVYHEKECSTVLGCGED
ncbi:hypothetical protein AB4098_01385 [Vibrio cyclitrophicus]